MYIVFTHHEGSQAERPAEIDTTSSKTVVYIRKNIERISREEQGEVVELWSYDEAELTPEQYWQYTVDMNQLDMRGKIEYIAMMTDVDLED